MQYRIVNDIGYLLGREYRAYSIEGKRFGILWVPIYVNGHKWLFNNLDDARKAILVLSAKGTVVE